MQTPALTLAAALLVVACGPAPSADPPADTSGRYAITGTVVGRPDGTTVTLAHDAIAGYMPAMIMDLRADALPPLVEGDRVRATLVVTDNRSRLTDVVVSRSVLPPPARERESEFPRLRVASLGEVMPDVALTNQDGDRLQSGDFRGRVLFVNFIYTRCPLPEFCPRLMARFDALRRSLDDEAELGAAVHFVSVTIDPAYDTPRVLRAYGERAITGPERFARWDLVTGDQPALRQLAAFGGVAYRTVDGWVEHSMESVLVGADGRLVRRFATGEWSHDEALAIAIREAGRARGF